MMYAIRQQQVPVHICKERLCTESRFHGEGEGYISCRTCAQSHCNYLTINYVQTKPTFCLEFLKNEFMILVFGHTFEK